MLRLLLALLVLSSLQPGRALAQLVFNQTASCCSPRRESAALLSCLERVDFGTRDIAILSYASSDIVDYAAYAFGVNSAFAEQNGYEMYFLNEAGGANYEPRDPRWNRVKILEEALRPDEGWLSTVEYVVWMDADLIVLDMDFDLRSIIAANSASDIIISSERHAETGVANTGCFIVKNSAWSRDFLREWWTTYDRSEAHDQIFFDKLYKSKLPGITEHVAILPTDAINSTPPPMLWQEDHNQVLHMMGQPAAIRQEAFMSAFDEVCQAHSKQRPLQHQLGLSKTALSAKAENFYVNEIRAHFPILNSTDFDLEFFYESATICLYDFTMLVELGIDVEVDIAGFNGLMNERIRVLASSPSPDLRSMVALYNLAVPYAELLYDVLTDSSYKFEMLNRVETYLNIMTPLLHASARHIAWSMQVKHYTTRGDFLQSLHHCSRAKDAYQRAQSIYHDLQEINPDELLLAALNEGLISVRTCSEAEEGRNGVELEFGAVAA